MDEDREHEYDNEECWCMPDMIFEFQGRQVWVHKGRGEELPPSRIIAQAVYNVLIDKQDELVDPDQGKE